MRVAHRWAFPTSLSGCDRPPAATTSSVEVVTFLLDRGGSVLVEGIECATLAHGVDALARSNGDREVLDHPYWARGVAADLRAMAGWDAGLVDVASWVRHPVSGNVVGAREATTYKSV